MAIYQGAQWRGPVPNQGGAMGPVRLIVMHIMEGYLGGTDSEFHNPSAQVSAHFGVGRDGTVYQWVDTANVAWAEANYNGEAISIEHEGWTETLNGEPPTNGLTLAQAVASARLIAWICFVHGVPLQRNTDPNGQGIIGHGELGIAGGNHPNCPSQPILDAIPNMIAWIIAQDQPPAPPPPPPVPAPPIPTMVSVSLPKLKPGMTHPAVQSLRDLLIRRGYGVPPTGTTYGNALAAAVTKFNTTNSISTTSTVNAATWTALLDK